MVAPIEVSKHEHGVVRVFAINASPEEAKHWAGEAAREDRTAEEALGAAKLDWAHMEVVDTDSVRALGLSTYLIDGLGLAEEEVARDRARLDALSGHVLIVSSGAFCGMEQTLRPGPALTLVGTYREPGVVPSFAPLESESARGVLTGGTGQAGPAARRGWRGWPIVLAGLALLLIVAVLLWAGG